MIGATNLAASDRAENNKRLAAIYCRSGKRRVHWLEGKILLAREEAQKRPAFKRGVIANGAAKHRVRGFESVKNDADSRRRRHFDAHLVATDARQRA